MGRQSKTIRNKRKIKVENYDNNYINSDNINKRVTKAFAREAQFTIISIFIVTIIMISSTYAIFSSVQKQKSYNTLTVGTLKIDFDQSSDDMGNIINLNGAYPTSDENGQETSPYSFKITNTGTLAAYYKAKIVDDIDMINEDGCQDNLLPKDKIKVSINNGTPFLLSSMEANSYIVNDGTLDASASKTFEIRIWIDESAGNEVLGKHYHGKIVVESANTKEKEPEKLCKRATTLHTETCSNTDTTRYCQADGYALNDTITYGSLGTTGTLTTGDAFDCDVNGDGVYDSTTERFYYLSDMTNGITTDSNIAVLIYYNNVSGGTVASNSLYAYDSSGKNNNGPVTAIKQLPTTEQWSNVSLINTTRAITNENVENTTAAGNLPTEFGYLGYAARLLTAQEVNNGCGFTVGSYTTGELSNKCKYLMENTKYSAINNVHGEWLETPASKYINNVFCTFSDYRSIRSYNANYSDNFAVRPAIEVAKSRIDF